jgi:hypothetical protein
MSDLTVDDFGSALVRQARANLGRLALDAINAGRRGEIEIILAQLHQTLNAAEAEVSRLRQDAARLDWLAHNPPNRDMRPMTSISRDQIDAARSSASPTGVSEPEAPTNDQG